MTTLIKTKFKISDDQTNIDKYRLATNITEYHIISKLTLQRIIILNDDKTIISCKNFPVERQKFGWNQSIGLGNWALVVQRDIWGKLWYWIGIPNELPVERKKFGWNWSIYKEIGLCASESHLR